MRLALARLTERDALSTLRRHRDPAAGGALTDQGVNRTVITSPSATT
jgi:hypothetical protein